MTYISMTNRNPGDPTRSTADIDQLIANDEDLNTRVNNLTGGQGAVVLNGGFELGTGADSAPTAWDLDLFSGGHTSYPAGIEGLQCFQFAAPGGGGNGGGQVTSENYFPVSEKTSLNLFFMLTCSISGVNVKAQVLFYDATVPIPSLISTVNVYSNASTNPTSWSGRNGLTTVPVNARQAKIRLIGGDIGSAAGNIAFDAVRFLDEETPGKATFYPPGTYTVRTKPNQTSLLIAGISGGGSGASSFGSGTSASGGGSGAYGKSYVDVYPDTDYTLTVGAGGPGMPQSGPVPGHNGNNGGNTAISTYTITGGGGGQVRANGAGSPPGGTAGVAPVKDNTKVVQAVQGVAAVPATSTADGFAGGTFVPPSWWNPDWTVGLPNGSLGHTNGSTTPAGGDGYAIIYS